MPSDEPRNRLDRLVVGVLIAVAVSVHAGSLVGPFPDGQHGNCGAMFSLFARNAAAIGVLETGGVPVLNPVPPAEASHAVYYTNHPPGLPWLVMLAARGPWAVETGGRLVALLLTIAAALLAADLAAGLAGGAGAARGAQQAGLATRSADAGHAGRARAVALATGLFMLLLPAGRHHGLLVNYETVAIPALLALTRALVLGRGAVVLVALCAALADWIALLPLVLVAPLVWRQPTARRRWGVAAITAVLVGAAISLLMGARVSTGLATTIQQAVSVSFLGAGFDAGAWVAAMRTHLFALFGWALIPAALVALDMLRWPTILRGTLAALLAIGVLNVVLFAGHATGHEHFSLLLLPFVAVGCGIGIVTRLPGPVALRGGIVVALLGLSSYQVWREAPARASTYQAELADRFAAASDPGTIYVRPAGISFVFLHRAARHISAWPASSLFQAMDRVAGYRNQFGVPDAAAALVLMPGDPAPTWIAPVVDLMHEVDGFRIVPLQGADGG